MYRDEVAVMAHMLAMQAYKELQVLMALPLPKPKPQCDDCPWGAAYCGKGCDGEPPELPELPAQG